MFRVIEPEIWDVVNRWPLKADGHRCGVKLLSKWTKTRRGSQQHGGNIIHTALEPIANRLPKIRLSFSPLQNNVGLFRLQSCFSLHCTHVLVCDLWLAYRGYPKHKKVGRILSLLMSVSGGQVQRKWIWWQSVFWNFVLHNDHNMKNDVPYSPKKLIQWIAVKSKLISFQLCVK